MNTIKKLKENLEAKSGKIISRRSLESWLKAFHITKDSEGNYWEEDLFILFSWVNRPNKFQTMEDFYSKSGALRQKYQEIILEGDLKNAK